MRMIYHAVLYDHVFCWQSFFSSFCIPAAFDTDAIIAGIKMTIFYQCIFATLQVKCIGIGAKPWIFYSEISYRDVFTRIDMCCPCREFSKVTPSIKNIFYTEYADHIGRKKIFDVFKIFQRFSA